MKKHIITFLLSAGLITAAFPAVLLAQNISIDTATATDESFTLDEAEYATAILRPDPLKRYNQWMFRVNDKIYRRIFTPISKVYDAIIPNPLQRGFNNFSQFLRTPIRFANNLLQGKFKNASTEVGRFLINGTVGVVGLFDPADHRLHIKQQTEDFAQTLGSYGVKPGAYIVLPLLGPSDPRDIIGLLGDMALNPFMWMSGDDPDTREVYSIYMAVDHLNNYTYNVRDTYERITDDAIDQYIAVQEFYIQNRDKNIQE